jgi:drug/metabolite transporter (DMT)-like permease
VSPIGIALALLASLAWGASFPAIAKCMELIEPLWVTAIRFGIAIPPLLVACYFVEGKRAFSLEGRLLPIFGIGAIGMGGYNIFAVYGIKYAGAEHAALIFAMVPLMTTVATAVRTRTFPVSLTIACTLAALVGIALVITGGDFVSFFHNASFAGDGLLFLGSAMWVYYTIARSKFASWSALRFTTATLVSGELVIVVATLISTAFFNGGFPSVEDLRETALLFAFLGIAPVIVAVIAYNAAISRLGPDRAALFINVVPVVTFVVQAIGGTRLPLIEYAGAAIVIAALIVNNLGGKHGAEVAHAHPRIS